MGGSTGGARFTLLFPSLAPSLVFGRKLSRLPLNGDDDSAGAEGISKSNVICSGLTSGGAFAVVVELEAGRWCGGTAIVGGGAGVTVADRFFENIVLACFSTSLTACLPHVTPPSFRPSLVASQQLPRRSSTPSLLLHASCRVVSHLFLARRQLCWTQSRSLAPACLGPRKIHKTCSSPAGSFALLFKFLLSSRCNSLLSRRFYVSSSQKHRLATQYSLSLDLIVTSP